MSYRTLGAGMQPQPYCRHCDSTCPGLSGAHRWQARRHVKPAMQNGCGPCQTGAPPSGAWAAAPDWLRRKAATPSVARVLIMA